MWYEIHFTYFAKDEMSNIVYFSFTCSIFINNKNTIMSFLSSKEERSKHILNTSVSKQMYSFTKAQRFRKEKKKDQCPFITICLFAK